MRAAAHRLALDLPHSRIFVELTDKFVLLTGGSRGLGPVIARGLARRGAHMALAARSEEGLLQTAAALRQHGTRTLTVPADLAVAEDRQRLVERVMGEFGRIDVLVNNAALENEGAFVDLEWESIAQTIELNLAAPLHLTRLVLPQMLARAHGHVVHISSLAGKTGTPYDAVYSGTKAALGRFNEGLRRELPPGGVGISTIYPSFVTGQGMFARFGMKHPMLVGSCTPEQVAAAVVRSIERGDTDVIVNSLPMRPVLALGDMFPSFGDWLMHRIGVVEFQRRKAGGAPSSGSPGV